MRVLRCALRRAAGVAALAGLLVLPGAARRGSSQLPEAREPKARDERRRSAASARAETRIERLARERAADARLLRAIAAHDNVALERELGARLEFGLAAALAALDRLPGADRSHTNDLCCRLVRRFVASAPQHARDTLVAVYGAPLPPAIVDVCYGTLAAVLPTEELAAHVLALPVGAEQRGAARQLVSRWAADAPVAALTWSRTHRATLDDAGLGALVDAAAASAPRAALDFLVGQAGTFQQAIHWEMKLGDLVAQNARADDAFAWLTWAAAQPLSRTAWNNLARKLFARVNDEAPAAALTFAMNLGEPHLRDELLAASARGAWVVDYGATHSVAALAALFENPTHRSEAVAQCVAGLAERNPRAALAQLHSLPDGSLKNAAIFAALPVMLHHDPSALHEWAPEISGPAAVRDEIVAEALRAVDAGRPRNAVRRADATGP